MTAIDFDATCANCSASLHGVDLDEKCPSCQTAISLHLNISAIDPHDLTISRDLPCRTCEYNLRGLYVGSRCPECGSPISQSLSVNALRFSDYKWLRAMRRGAIMMIAGGTLVVSSQLTAIWSFTISLFSLSQLAMIVAAVSYILSAAGATRVTLNEPGTNRQRRLPRLAFYTQLLVYAPILCIVAELCFPKLSEYFVLLLACTPIGYLFVFVNIRRIANRVGESQLAKSAKRVAIALAVGTGLCLFNILFTHLLYSQQWKSNSTVALTVFWVVLVFICLLYFLALIRGMLTLLTFNQLLRDAISKSPQHLKTDDKWTQAHQRHSTGDS